MNTAVVLALSMARGVRVSSRGGSNGVRCLIARDTGRTAGSAESQDGGRS
jgi:hypothetical protein